MGIIKRRYRKKKQQKPVTSYRAEVYVQGIRVSAKTFPTKREAVLWHDRERCKFSESPTSSNDQMRLKDCIDEFCKDIETRLMASTLQKYKSQLTYLYSSPLANMKMSEIKGVKIIGWLNWLKKPLR